MYAHACVYIYKRKIPLKIKYIQNNKKKSFKKALQPKTK